MTHQELVDFARMNGLPIREAAQLLGEESMLNAHEAVAAGKPDPRTPYLAESTGVPMPPSFRALPLRKVAPSPPIAPSPAIILDTEPEKPTQ